MTTSQITETINAPKSVIDWRLMEARYAAVVARHEALLGPSDKLSHRYAGPEAETALRDVSHEMGALEGVIFDTPAVDRAGVLFKLKIFDVDFHGAEEMWKRLREEVISLLSAEEAAAAN